MKERISPPIGTYQVRAHACEPDQDGWHACGQTWMAGTGGQPLLLAEVRVGPHASEGQAVEQAYERAYADTLRLILREFVCL